MTPEQKDRKIKHLIAIRKRTEEELAELGVPVLDGATQEGMLRSELSEIVLLLNEVGSILGHTGPSRELPDYAKKIMEQIKPS